MTYTFRPLVDRTWVRSGGRPESQFTASYEDTLDLLHRELDLVNARNVVIEVACSESDIYADGKGIRASARVDLPAVMVAFETHEHGPMMYPCDTYERGRLTRSKYNAKLQKDVSFRVMPSSWQHNLRAIALTLEALRTVNRHGAAGTGKQYTGFKALPAGRAMPASHMTGEQARQILYRHSDHEWNQASPAEHYKAAKRRTHPDRNGGDQTAWDQVEEAAKVLRLLP